MDKTRLQNLRTQSIRALPVCAVLLVLVAGLLFVIGRYVTIPRWLAAAMLGVGIFTVAGDAINIVYLTRRLRRVDRRDTE
ncbi:MAG: hypothetical protein H6817_03530 [Phycisphaerales bacterium]|nr:hypothetical protein [Phycisphaerales bacterium]